MEHSQPGAESPQRDPLYHAESSRTWGRDALDDTYPVDVTLRSVRPAHIPEVAIDTTARDLATQEREASARFDEAVQRAIDAIPGRLLALGYCLASREIDRPTREDAHQHLRAAVEALEEVRC